MLNYSPKHLIPATVWIVTLILAISLSPSRETRAQDGLPPDLAQIDVSNVGNLEILMSIETDSAIEGVDVAASENGYHVAVISGEDITLVSIDNSTTTTKTLSRHTDHISRVSFNHDGTRLATASWDETIQLWDVATGEQSLTIETHTTDWGSMAFDPNDEILASGGSCGLINLWDVESGQLLGTLQGSDLAPISSLAFNPSGQFLASAHGTGIWIMNLNQMERERILTAPATNVVAFDNAGHYFAAKTDNGYVLLWDATIFESIPVEQEIDDQILTNNDLSFNLDGTIVAVSHEERVRFWDTETGQELTPLETGVLLSGINFAPDGKLLVTTHIDGTINFWGIPKSD